MRELAVAIAASIVANAVAIAWLSPSSMTVERGYTDVSGEPPEAPPAPELQPDPEPLAVALLDEPISEPAPTIPIRTRPLARTNSVRAADSTVRAADSTVRAANSTVRAADSTVRAADSTVRAPDSRSKLMTMREPDPRVEVSPSGQATDHPVDLALSSKAIEAVLSRRAAETPPTGSTKEHGPADEPDEAAQLHQQISDLELKLANPAHLEHASDDQLEAEREDLESKRKDLAQMTIHPTGGGRYASNQDTFKASVEPDGTTHLEDTPNLQPHGLGFRFDVTDWAMRVHGDDPYSRAKMRFLDRTRKQRYEIGKHYRTEQLSRSGELMQKAIDQMWATVRDPAQRKQALFELWDDCAETGDAALVEAGTVARTIVLGVIRARVHYTDNELARLNAQRQSTARFEP